MFVLCHAAGALRRPAPRPARGCPAGRGTVGVQPPSDGRVAPHGTANPELEPPAQTGQAGLIHFGLATL